MERLVERKERKDRQEEGEIRKKERETDYRKNTAE